MSDDNIVPDCLVLKLEEVEVNTGKIDTSLYILYDVKNQYYVIRGKRNVRVPDNSPSYSFTCECEKKLVDFLEYIICSFNLVNERLYNYVNLSYDSNNITYEFLEENESKINELSGYDNEKYMKRSRLLKLLRILKNVFNYYN